MEGMAATPSAPASSSAPSNTSTSPTQSNASQSATQSSGNSYGTSSQQSSSGQSQSSPELFEVKVNGKVMKMTRDEVVAHASMSHAAQQRFEEAARIRKQSEQLLSRMKTPDQAIEALTDPSLGLNKDQIRDAFEKWYTREFIDPERLSPEQRELQEYKRRVQQFEEQQRQAEMEQQRTMEEQVTAQHREYYQQQIMDAIEKANLPRDKETAARIAFYMRKNLMNGWDAPLDVVIQQVKQERQSYFKTAATSMEVPQLIEMIGEDVINKIRKHDLEQLRLRRQQSRTSANPSQSGTDGYGNAQNTKISSAEVQRRLRDMRTGRFK